jgi:galactokinase
MSRRCVAFAPGRVNLIGEHTDYNGGLALPFAIEQGVTVVASRLDGGVVEAYAADLGESDSFPLSTVDRADGWRAFVRGAVAELGRAGHEVPPCRLEITGTVPVGSGLSSSAAVEVALTLALLGLAGESTVDRVALAKLCSTVENDWVGARTGLLDQLASLLSREGEALRIDFSSLATRTVPLRLSGWTLATVDSGETHSLSAAGGYNQRRAECRDACAALGVTTLTEAVDDAAIDALPDVLRRRTRHVLAENARVDAAYEALRADDLPRLGVLLDASHASLRDLYEVSTPAVDATVDRARAAGAAGARLMGGGFGGHILTLFPPGVLTPSCRASPAPVGGTRPPAVGERGPAGPRLVVRAATRGPPLPALSRWRGPSSGWPPSPVP